MRADDAETSGYAGAAAADVGLLGHVVKVQPVAVAGVHDALGAQDGAVFLLVVQRGEDRTQLGLGELLRRLRAPAREDLVGVMVVMVVALAVGIVALALIVAVVMVVMPVLPVPVVVVVWFPDRSCRYTRR